MNTCLSQVILFSPTDYPDMTSGGVEEIIVTPLTEAQVNIVASAFYSSESIMEFSVPKRKCIFTKEIKTLRTGMRYTYSDCIVECKLKDIEKTCGCRPFIYPRRGAHNC